MRRQRMAAVVTAASIMDTAAENQPQTQYGGSDNGNVVV